MKKYLLVYYGGKMETDPKKVKASTDAWMKWFKDMGAAVVEAGNPTAPGAMVTAKGVKKGAPKDPVTGYSIIQADDLDKAAEWAKRARKSLPKVKSQSMKSCPRCSPEEILCRMIPAWKRRSTAP